MQISTHFSQIYISSEIEKIISKILNESNVNKIFILVDENTKKYCFPLLSALDFGKEFELIEIGSGEKNKTIQTVTKVWQFLSEKGADRSSLFINLGGGIVCDLGGFAASTFKRGIPFINIPTTLLSQVDASVGGKTGVNFLNLKNEIGVFNHPKHVIINSTFLKTLEKENILSGWAEMLKHALIFSKADWDNLVSFKIHIINFKTINELISRSVNIKNHFVEKDPFEKDIRKALNFGHTFGHAFESFFMGSLNEISHGKAIAHGIMCELYLSNKKCLFPDKDLDDIVKYISTLYGKLIINPSDFEKIFEFITHDKKNEGIGNNLTLLKDFGQVEINQKCTHNELIEALNWYCNLS